MTRRANSDHHLTPLSEKGDDSPSNKLRICRKCHRKINKALTNKEMAMEAGDMNTFFQNKKIQLIMEDERRIYNAKLEERDKWKNGRYDTLFIVSMLALFFAWVEGRNLCREYAISETSLHPGIHTVRTS